MKLLIVAMANSIHTARWISLINDQGWDIYLFPVDFFTEVHPIIANLEYQIRVHGPKFLQTLIKKYKVMKSGIKTVEEIDTYELLKRYEQGEFSIKSLLRKLFPVNYLKELYKIIKKVKPDVIHSMHIQEAAFLTMEVKKMMCSSFPAWIVSNWGSEIDLFRFFPDQRKKIMEVLKNCDYYSGECVREIPIIKDLGFKGKIFAIIPNSGGVDFEYIKKFRSSGSISSRRIIMLKGYSNWAGRAITGLRALERCCDMLEGYKIVIYCVDSLDVKIAATYFTIKTGIETIILPFGTTHEEILNYHGNARISIGLSITDAISTSVLEAMAMGSFPIQSKTSCANDWFVEGKSGIMVSPEDSEEVEKAIRIALTDDKLVEDAAEINYRILFEKLGKNKIKSLIIEAYKGALTKNGN
ncbi:MAG: glycosyltransferase [Actinobacteria bacterium]|nr:glycosyltransferase [Actinomycetota bacterium]